VPMTDLGIIDFIMKFGKQYGYDFEHEETWDKFCLVNDAVYVAGLQTVPWEDVDTKPPTMKWKAVGAQFQHPYVFKTLFSNEELEFSDYCEGRSVVKGAMYLDKSGELPPDISNMRHIGKTGLFVPVNSGGGTLYRVNDGKYYAVSGTKGHLWLEADVAKLKDDLQIDMSYFNKLKDTAIGAIEQFGSFEEFVGK
jgi:hypothetical protein